MKNSILKIIGIFTLMVFLFTSCEDALVKDEIDAKFAVAVEDQPTVSISQPANLTAKSVDLTVTVSDMANVVELGVLRSADASFEKPGSIKIVSEESTATVKLGLAPLTDYFVKAYAVTKSGSTVFSEVISFKTPDAPFIEKITGDYKANLNGYWGDKYTSTITIKPGEAEGELVIENLCPYFYTNGFTAAKGVNIFAATYDEDASTITIASGQPVGYQDVAFTVHKQEALVIQVKDNGATLAIGDVMWGMASAAGWYELYLGNYNYTK